MTAAVVRARQRREEEEKKIERSRQAAHEKLRALEEKAALAEKDPIKNIDIEERPHSTSKSKDDRQPRDKGNFQTAAYGSSKSYAKNIPPRFQKQAEIMRQQQQAQQPIYDQRYSETNFNRNISNEPRNSSFQTNIQPLAKPILLTERSRSESQGSGQETIEGERERQTPDTSRKNRQFINTHKNPNYECWRTDNREHIQLNRFPSNSSEPRIENNRERLYESDSYNKRGHKEVKGQKSDDMNRDFDRVIQRPESSERKREDVFSSEKSFLRDEKFKNESLDWTSERDNIPLGGNAHFGKNWRPVPITQKQFESIAEPVKKNFTPLKKLNAPLNFSTYEKEKEKDIEKDKSNIKGDKQIHSDATSKNKIVENEKLVGSSNKQHGSVDTEKSPEDKSSELKKESSKSKNERKSETRDKGQGRGDRTSRRGGGSRIENLRGHSGRSNFAPVNAPYRGGRARVYRRSRDSRERKDHDESKQKNFQGKSKRRSFSEGSSASKEHNKERTSTTQKPAKAEEKTKSNQESPKTDKIVNQDALNSNVANASASTASSRGDNSRRGRGSMAFRNNNNSEGSSNRVVPRSYGPSNYGPPSLKAAFGDGGRQDQRKSDRHDKVALDEQGKENQKTQKTDSKSQYITNSNVSASRGSASADQRSHRKGSYPEGHGDRSHRNPHDSLPPRFQKKSGQDPYRNWGVSGWGERRNPGNLENDNINDEWENVSESSDLTDRKDQRKSGMKSFSSQRPDYKNFPKSRNERKHEQGKPHGSSESHGNYKNSNNNSGGNYLNNVGICVDTKYVFI